MKIWDDVFERAATTRVFEAIEGGGHLALFVGGCVRDALMGKPAREVDMATDALPERVAELVSAAGLKAVHTGAGHGTVTVVSQGIAHEVTTFRRDTQTFGRRATVDHDASIRDDAMRRDFTMNALYAKSDGTVIDPLDGIADLKAGRVRFVGSPRDRIREDYLRILRFFRMHAWHGDPEGGMDADALDAAAELADGMSILSRERVGAEIIKLLAAPDPAPAAAAMASCGALARILPGADAAPLAALVHLERECGAAPDAVRRLAAIGGEDVAARLRLDAKSAKRLDLARRGIASATPPPEAAYRHGIAAGFDALLVGRALAGAPVLAEEVAAVERAAAAQLPVQAADLMPELSGAALGRRIGQIERRWIDSGFTASRDELLRDRD